MRTLVFKIRIAVFGTMPRRSGVDVVLSNAVREQHWPMAVLAVLPFFFGTYFKEEQ